MKLHPLQHSLFNQQSPFKENRFISGECASDDFNVRKAPASAPSKKTDNWGETLDAASPSAEDLRDKIENKIDNLVERMDTIIDDLYDKYSPAYKEKVVRLKRELLTIQNRVFRLNVNAPGALETLNSIDLRSFEEQIANPLLTEQDPAALENEMFRVGREIKTDYFNKADQIIGSFIERNFGYVEGLHDLIHRGLIWIAKKMRENRPGRAEMLRIAEDAVNTKDPQKFKLATELITKSNNPQVLGSFSSLLNDSSIDAWNHYVVFIRKSLAAMDHMSEADKTEMVEIHTKLHEGIAAKGLSGEIFMVADIERYNREFEALKNKAGN